MDHDQINYEIMNLRQELGEEARSARSEGKEPWIEYKPGEGWRRKK